MKYLNALYKIDGIGSQKLKLLIDFFGSGKKIWQASFKELLQSNLSENLAKRIDISRSKIDPDYEMQLLKKENIQIIGFNNKNFPKLLKEIPSFPYLLYLKGDAKILNTPMMAMVGSRKFTSYGKQVALSLAKDLSSAGITIVSGMAMGIDTFSHYGTLMAGGKTIAVLGSGLDNRNIGPKQNFNLSKKIIEYGALVSDYPYGTKASNFTFPARNRLMAGLTMGTIVVEAEEKSGTLITANLALEYNREVFAVPGSIFSKSSQGANNLIKKGAKLINGIQDILEELNMQIHPNNKQIETNLSSKEKLVVKKLSQEPMRIDRIIKATKLKPSVVLSILSILEIKKIIKDIGGQKYIIL